MSKKMLPIEALQRYLYDLNQFQDSGIHYHVVVDPNYFYLVKHQVTDAGYPAEVIYKTSNFERFYNKVSFISRKQVRRYMKDITYPYKRKVGHAERS